MAKRIFLLLALGAAAGLVLLAGPALAQTPADPSYVGGTEQVRTPVAGGTEQVRAPARAQAEGTGQDRQTLPVTGSDVVSLVVIGVGCVVVGSILRYRRQLVEE